MKKFVLASGALAATTITALLLGATPAVAQPDEFPDQAYALGASGLIDIPPTPYVRASDGEPVSDDLLSIGAEELGLSVSALTVAAEAGRAETSVADLQVAGLLTADVVRTSCVSGPDGPVGGIEIVNGSVLGTPLPRTPLPETEIDLSPVLNLRLNAQGRNSDGSLTVHGLQLILLPDGRDVPSDAPLEPAARPALDLVAGLLDVDLPADIGTAGELLEVLGPITDRQVVVVGHATCSDVDDSARPEPDTEPTPAADDEPEATEDSDEPDAELPDLETAPVGDLPWAPAPTVVTASLPVTG